MNIFIYGDESGVFDQVHNDVYVFGGLIFLSKEERDRTQESFLKAENEISLKYAAKPGSLLELKASKIRGYDKGILLNSTDGCFRYAFIIDQKQLNPHIFANTKSAQRYLDYVYKVGIKKCLLRLIQWGHLIPSRVENIYVRFDEHTTATDDKYELREALEEELKIGTFNFKFDIYHEPIFPNMPGVVEFDFKNSLDDPLIRASDIIANFAFNSERRGMSEKLKGRVSVVRFPRENG